MVVNNKLTIRPTIHFKSLRCMLPAVPPGIQFVHLVNGNSCNDPLRDPKLGIK